nr:MAG TPA: hypothetical protein [Caudoviricetes sp.]DAW30934.1 MAG TPA: hypothetical protein [Caudoviricetes sp.]DAW46254.1 MAG TPA: hypothetical protein [Bacteriophage sp.]
MSHKTISLVSFFSIGRVSNKSCIFHKTSGCF